MSPATAAEQGELTTYPITIVLADDSDDVRELLRASLQFEGDFQVVAEASDGEETIQVVAEHKPDVLILDLHMPVLDGIDAIPHVIAASPQTKILVLSGFSSDTTATRALNLGAHDYIEKGAPGQELITKIRRLSVNESGTPIVRALSSSSEEDFLSLICHELLGPLTVIQGFSETLQRGVDQLPSELVQRSIDSIDRSAKHMGSLIQAIADARKIEVDALDLILERISIGSLVRQTLEDHRTVIEPHPLNLTINTEDETAADPVRIRQVVLNLVSNAAKYSPLESEIQVDVSRHGPLIDVSVADRGEGISPEVTKELFKKFTRLGTSIKGMGLGLYISKGIAKAHGGNLVYEVPDEGGSRFVLSLPTG